MFVSTVFCCVDYVEKLSPVVDARCTVNYDVRCPMHGELRMLDGRCPMLVLLNADRRCPMHVELRMLDGRCTMHVLWKSIVNAHETLAFPRNQRKPKRFEQTSFWVNRKHRWWSKISLVDGKGKDETMLKKSLKQNIFNQTMFWKR